MTLWRCARLTIECTEATAVGYYYGGHGDYGTAVTATTSPTAATTTALTTAPTATVTLTLAATRWPLQRSAHTTSQRRYCVYCPSVYYEPSSSSSSFRDRQHRAPRSKGAAAALVPT